jgi:hypothetical protein
LAQVGQRTLRVRIVPRGRPSSHERAGSERGLRVLLLVSICVIVISWPAVPNSSSQARDAPSLARSSSGNASRTVPSAELAPKGIRADQGSGVNPFRYYHEAPAPMGIVDYGVNRTLVPYRYSTTEFEGLAAISKLEADSSSGHTVSFQLNVFLQLTNSTTVPPTISEFWVQNTLSVQTGGTGGDYWDVESTIWNLTSAQANFGSSDVQGNGSIVPETGTNAYISCAPSCGGDWSDLQFPATLGVRVVSLSSDGAPAIGLDYWNQTTWTRYDTVVFPNAGRIHLNDEGFTVDGTNYTSIGALQDAEWIYASAGNGATQIDRGSALNLSLEYWNGHNLQAPRSAWDFGSDTAETMQNVVLSTVGGPGGTPVANVRGNGTESLGALYDNSDVGQLEVNATVPAGTLVINGSSIPFSTGSASLVLEPGTYSVSIVGLSKAPQQITVRAGTTTFVTMGYQSAASFVEFGLSKGTRWSVTVDNETNSTSGTSLTLDLPNGSYSLLVSRLAGFVLDDPPGSVTIPAPQPVLLTWSAFRSPVPVMESGLPESTDWWVNVSGQRFEGNVSTLEATAPNGTDPFTVGAPYVFVPTPTSGSIDVDGGSVSPVFVSFSYRPTFIAGTVAPAGATISVGEIVEQAVDGRFNLSVIPGIYTLVASAPGFVNESLTVNATPGNVTPEMLVLAHLLNPSGPSSSAWAPGPDELAGAGGFIAVALAVFLVHRRRRRSGRTPG